MPAPTAANPRRHSPGAIIFDLWDTLTEPVPAQERLRLNAEVGNILGVDGSAFAKLVGSTFARRCRGELGDLEATLVTLCRQMGSDPTPDRVAAAASHRMLTQARLMRSRPDAIVVLERLRAAGRRIGLLTDSTCETEALWDEHELSALVDVAVFSCAEGLSKPDPSFFEMATSRLEVGSGDCAYVADGRSGELDAAAAAGMRAIQLVDSRHQGADEWAGENAGSLTAVADLLLSPEPMGR